MVSGAPYGLEKSEKNKTKTIRQKKKKSVGEWSCSAVPQMKSLQGHLPGGVVVNDAHPVW